MESICQTVIYDWIRNLKKNDTYRMRLFISDEMEESIKHSMIFCF